MMSAARREGYQVHGDESGAFPTRRQRMSVSLRAPRKRWRRLDMDRIDANSKLIVSWHVGDRSQYTGVSSHGRLEGRLANRVQTHHGRPQGLSNGG